MACSFWKTRGLKWAHILARYPLWYLMTYMMDEWNFSSIKAAAIVNAFWGSALMMQFMMQFAVDVFMSSYWMAVFSSFAYSIGLCLLSSSIMVNQKILFFIALVVISVGMSGSNSISLDELIKEGERDLSKFQYYLNKFASIIVHLVGALVFTYVYMSWEVTFWIPSICMVVATLIFCTGLSSYNHIEAQGSPLLTPNFKDAVVSFLKLRLHKHLGSSHTGLGYGRFEQQRNDRLGRATEAEETERSEMRKRRFLVCMAFFLLGVVSAIGETYFIQQADAINGEHEPSSPEPSSPEPSSPAPSSPEPSPEPSSPEPSSLQPSSLQLQLLYYFAEYLFPQIYKLIANHINKHRKTYAGCAGIAVSMIFAILCCFTAAHVETNRLKMAKISNRTQVLEKSNVTANTNITTNNVTTFSLLPQFILLGGLDGISSQSIEFLFSNDPPKAIDPYLKHLAHGFLGLGNIGSVLSVQLAGKASAWRDGTSWFADELDNSRLDKYYWVLAAMSIANFLCYDILYYWHDLWKTV